jgi:hypothetical protein
VLAMVVTAWLQRRSLADSFAREQDTATQLEQQLARRSGSAIEKSIEADPLVPVRKKWANRAMMRGGRIDWYDELAAALGAAQKEGKLAPLLVHFEFGDVPGRTPSPNLGQIVLAATENRPTAEIDQALKEIVEKLVGKAGLAKVIPGPTWSAGGLVSTAPNPPDTRALRHRFRHAAFELSWEQAP